MTAFWMATAAMGPILTTLPAQAQAAAESRFDIQAQPLADALLLFATQSGYQVAADGAAIQGVQGNAVQGALPAATALGRLLAGTGFTFRMEGTVATIDRAPQTADGAILMGPLRVEGDALHGFAVPRQGEIGSLPVEYAGGEVARGGKVGLLGSRDIMDTPFNVTHYTAQYIDNQQAQNLGDVLAGDPSIRNTYSRGSGRDEFNVRGFTLFNYDVAFNGLYGISPRNSSTMIGVERVEVLRGPNALLNGMAPSGSVGGSVNLVPKRAGSVPITRLTASHISDSQWGLHADLGRRFGEAEQVGVRLNALYRDGDTAPARSSEELKAATLGLDYQAERFRLEADLNYQYRLTHARSGLLFPPAAGVAIPKAPDADGNFFPDWTYWKTDERSGAVRGEFDITPDLTLFAAAGAREYDFESIQTSWLLLDAAGSIGAVPARLDEYINTTTAEAGLRGRFTTGSLVHSPVISASRLDQKSGQARVRGTTIFSNLYNPAGNPLPALAAITHIPKVGTADITSLAVADTIATAGENVQLTLGLRHQKVETANFDAVTGARTSHYDKSANTPAVALVVKPLERLSLYGNYIEGLSQGPTAPTAAVNAGEVFAPFITKQYEVGAKYDFGDFGGTVSLFQIDRPSSYVDPVSLRFDVDGNQRNRGLELSLYGALGEDVRLLGGAAFTRGKLTRTQGGVNDGRTAPAVPKRQFNLAGEWDVPFLEALTLTSRVTYTSPQFVDVGNTQRLPDWTRWDLGLRYAVDAGGTPLTLRATLENVLDKDYWQSAAREGLTVGPPRTVLVSVTADF
ncbi:TonB-dependent siderophore receptor [Niveispirillum fermenti]|uniref:TonB-dependent siderophore receptor n=1 Tax=Niveispirillum fermenti TaxID=1233113 RepID=UPI003A83CF91